MIPRHFVSLQQSLPTSVFHFENYYFGAGGARINLTTEILLSVGLTDDTLWAHPSVVPKLELAARYVGHHGFHLLIRDAWRPRDLYPRVIELQKKHRPEAVELMSGESMPHATGMAVDAVLVDPKTKKQLRMRNQPRDGNSCCRFGYYRNRSDAKSSEYHRLQFLLVSMFHIAGFRLGGKREYWHFELPELASAERF